MTTSNRQFSRRAFLRMAAGTATLAAAAACVPMAPADPAQPAAQVETAPGQEKRAISFWHTFSTDPTRSQVGKVAEDFNAANDAYEMEVVFVEFSTYTEKLLPSIVAGSPPDLALSTGMIDAPPWGLANQIAPMDDFLASSQELSLEMFVPYTQTALTYDGRLWGIPFLPDTRFLHMDVDAMEEAGLDPSQPPQTWDELWEYAHALDVGSAPNWERVGFSPTWGNTWPWTMAWTNGARFVDENNNFTINTPEVIETAAWYKEWVDYYGLEPLQAFASTFGPGAQDPFTSGINPLQVNGVWYPDRIKNQNPDMRVAYAMIPHKTEQASWGAGHPFVIPINSGSPDGAWTFIEYVMSYETLLEWIQVTGRMVGRMDVMEDPILMESKEHWPVAVESIRVTRERPLVPEVPTWYSLVNLAFNEVWEGVKTPEQALNDAQAAAEQELANYRATQQ